MDDITTRTIIIAVNIFVTLTIVTIVILMFSQMQTIYKIVLKTDNSIYSKFDDVSSMYNGKTETGIGLLNTLKKYEDGTEDVEIKYPESDKIRAYIANYNSSHENDLREVTCLKGLMEDGKCYDSLITNVSTTFKYEDKYNVVVELIENGRIQISFEKK